MSNFLSFFYAGDGAAFIFATAIILGLQIYYRANIREVAISFLIGFLLFVPSLTLVLYVQPAFYFGAPPGTVFQPTVVMKLFGGSPILLYFFASVLSFWYLSYKRLVKTYKITKLGWWKDREKWELRR